EMNNILDDECLRLFSQAEIIFYSFGQTNDSTAFKLGEVTESKDEFKNRIIDDCNKCIKRAGYYDINEFISEISEDNYEWGKYFHYLFLTYNNVGIEECMKLIDEKIYAFTIEHIIPQNIINNGLLKNYKFENEDDFNKLKNTFGNLIPLEKILNSICSDRSLLDKKEYYKKSKLSCNLSFANDENFLNFEKKQIIKRNEDFTKWARKFFVDFLKITQK
ncbi:HNH endonuclease, partial [Campylobacter jejuni]|nr:HNH endonuclease [Campylobacter jejuni]EAJ6846039.1 HNH endonuclease [Campylobacter coli]EHP2240417.1 HNH endonuclease [Campylobacter jejuni]EHV4782115.1 HNH endonuclease [Campylobacter coli]EKK7117497.1 HNH endonuclease [Campylobacter jejuni]